MAHHPGFGMQPCIASHAWHDTFVVLPDSAILDDVFTGQRMAAGLCAVHSLLGRLPVALLA